MRFQILLGAIAPISIIDEYMNIYKYCLMTAANHNLNLCVHKSILLSRDTTIYFSVTTPSQQNNRYKNKSYGGCFQGQRWPCARFAG